MPVERIEKTTTYCENYAKCRKNNPKCFKNNPKTFQKRSKIDAKSLALSSKQQQQQQQHQQQLWITTDPFTVLLIFGRCFRQFWLAGPTRVGTSASPKAPGELQKTPRRSSRGTRRVPEGTQSITLNKVMVLIPKRSLIVAKKLRDPGLTEM